MGLFIPSLNLYMFQAYVAHQQEVFTVYVQQLVRIIHLSWLVAGRVRIELFIPSLNLYMFQTYVAHQQEVFTVYVNQLVRIIRLSWLAAGQVRMELIVWRNKLRISRASSWFSLQRTLWFFIPKHTTLRIKYLSSTVCLSVMVLFLRFSNWNKLVCAAFYITWVLFLPWY
jgi:hypothetical protein